MSLRGKKSVQVEIKSDGDVFHELIKVKPHHLPDVSPTTIQRCEIHDGEPGKVGCVLFWNYFHDGKDRVLKTIVQDINDEKKTVMFKMIEGDLLELYKNFDLTVHVDTKGSSNLVTYTVEYEKLSPEVPDPDTLMDWYTALTKDIEAHHLKN